MKQIIHRLVATQFLQIITSSDKNNVMHVIRLKFLPPSIPLVLVIINIKIIMIQHMHMIPW